MNIERIPASTRPEDFYTNYFVPEIPVIITGTADQWPAKKAWAQGKLAYKLTSDRVRKRTLWYETDSSYVSDDYAVPELIRRCTNPDVSSSRIIDRRFWVSPQGNETNFHHDGNALFVFNVQVIGRKRWTIVSPDTPLSYFPFSHIALPQYYLTPPGKHTGHTLYTFELQEGEMLFLPPFWAHQVIALEKENINLNWIGTKKNMRESPLLEREREMLKCAITLPFFTKAVSYMNRAYAQHYAGNGALAYALAEQVSTARMWKRCMREYLRVPALVKHRRGLKEHY